MASGMAIRMPGIAPNTATPAVHHRQPELPSLDPINPRQILKFKQPDGRSNDDRRECGVGRSLNNIGAATMTRATTAAPTTPVICVFAPAASATGVRDELLLIGNPERSRQPDWPRRDPPFPGWGRHVCRSAPRRSATARSCRQRRRWPPQSRRAKSARCRWPGATARRIPAAPAALGQEPSPHIVPLGRAMRGSGRRDDGEQDGTHPFMRLEHQNEQERCSSQSRGDPIRFSSMRLRPIAQRSRSGPVLSMEKPKVSEAG